ncbi:hypothetical protein HMI54_002374, partial [Coelomomyces lativittatus]
MVAKQKLRLYSKARILGYKRSQRNQQTNQTLLKIEGVNSRKDARFYFGKRVAYVYKAPKDTKGLKIRVLWGRISRSHGNSGVVKALFKKSPPPKAFGQRCRV